MTSTRSLFRTCAIPWRMLREPDIVAHANDPLIISFARLLLLLLLEDGLETVGRKNPKHVNSENKPEKNATCVRLYVLCNIYAHHSRSVVVHVDSLEITAKRRTHSVFFFTILLDPHKI